MASPRTLLDVLIQNLPELLRRIEPEQMGPAGGGQDLSRWSSRHAACEDQVLVLTVRDLKMHRWEWLGRVQAVEVVEVTSRRSPSFRRSARRPPHRRGSWQQQKNPGHMVGHELITCRPTFAQGAAACTMQPAWAV
ncbi:hypothetical protein KBY97_12465 [Synechococcus sp. ATX 2A4]|uniref:hypothetical protein n=1 Tax=Synechococcus sp. ATX 2A4 TaxID=2823727 RepID=UPI0020CD2C66|nr:hypothetical protein [Synechococcus sp. ATX 2A4]MCP9885927.1 hypothetical protein [Synechococcus sp. ATX 2A4]